MRDRGKPEQTRAQDWGPVHMPLDERTREAWRLPEPEPASPPKKDREERESQ